MQEQDIINQFQSESTPNLDSERPPQGVPEQGIDLKTKLDIFQSLDIDMHLLSDDQTNEQIRDIYDWGKISGISEDQMIITLNEISSRLGHQADKTQFQNVWEWVRLDVERRKIDSKMKSMERING